MSFLDCSFMPVAQPSEPDFSGSEERASAPMLGWFKPDKTSISSSTACKSPLNAFFLTTLTATSMCPPTFCASS